MHGTELRGAAAGRGDPAFATPGGRSPAENRRRVETMSEGTPKSQTKTVVPDGSPARPQAGTHHRTPRLLRSIPLRSGSFDRRRTCHVGARARVPVENPISARRRDGGHPTRISATGIRGSGLRAGSRCIRAASLRSRVISHAFRVSSGVLNCNLYTSAVWDDFGSYEKRSSVKSNTRFQTRFAERDRRKTMSPWRRYESELLVI